MIARAGLTMVTDRCSRTGRHGRAQPSLPQLPIPPQLLAELWFYAYAHRQSQEERREALRHLRKLIEVGARSQGWDLSGNMARAQADGHPEAKWLERMAAVISGGAEAAVLTDRPAWQEAVSNPVATREA